MPDQHMDYRERQHRACDVAKRVAGELNQEFQKKLAEELGDDASLISMSWTWHLHEPPRQETHDLTPSWLGWLHREKSDAK